MADPGRNVLSALERLMRETDRAEAMSKSAQRGLEFAQMQAMLDMEGEAEDAAQEEEAQRAAAEAAEQARQAAVGPFQLDLPASGAIAERPVTFRNTLSQLPVDGMRQAAAAGQSASSMIQQRLRDAGVTPSGVPEAAQGLPVAGPMIQTRQAQRSGQFVPTGERGDFVFLPRFAEQVQETPNALGARDLLEARLAEARQFAEGQQAAERQRGAQALEEYRQRGRMRAEELRNQLAGAREQDLAKLKDRLERARKREEAAGLKLSPTAEKQLADFSKDEATARGSQLASLSALRLLDQYSKSTMAGTGLQGTVKSFLGPLASGTQDLEAALNELAVQKVINVAKEAGARSADSDAERTAIASTAPSIDKDDEVNRRIILAMASQSTRAEYLARAKQEHLALHGNLRGFNPVALDEQIETIFAPDTMEMTVLQRGEPIPEGWQSVRELLLPTGSSLTIAKPRRGSRLGQPPVMNPQPQAPEGMVRMRAPDGSFGFVPRDRLRDAITRGARPVTDGR